MKQVSRRIVVFVLALGLGALSACGRKDNSIEPVSTATASAAPSYPPASQATNPLPGVIPVPLELPGHTGTGPSVGSTAIGGLTGKQEAGGQTSGSPAPTGGDAAPAKPGNQ